MSILDMRTQIEKTPLGEDRIVVYINKKLVGVGRDELVLNLTTGEARHLSALLLDRLAEIRAAEMGDHQ